MQLFSDKNITPKYLAFICALFLFIVSVLFLFFLSFPFLKAIFAGLLISVSAGLLFYYALNHFFYRKIKLIYKFIAQTKANYQEESLKDLLPIDTNINDASNEVMQWAQSKHFEIETLKQNEIYRRDFLMNFSHEIKTPIFSVQGYLHTLISGAINDENVRDKFLKNATKGIDKLADMVLEIDEISKLEIGDIKLNKSKFEILDLVHDTYAELQLEADAKGIELSIKEGARNKTTVFADRLKIKQVIANLVNNAIKYGRQDGHITAAIYNVDELNIYLEITDNGNGISESDVPRVFERFYRTDDGRQKNTKGTGLGLAIVKHIIEAHGHSISCRSAIGVGSSFGFGLSKA
jgi:two-component system, OmpR family, phosphate regulon sensor histidine kinase PhoR